MDDVKQQIAHEALAIVNGARRQAYGTPEQNFARISALQTAYLTSRRDGASAAVSPLDVAMLALMTKVARIAESPTHRDSFVDLVGYSLCAAEVAGLDGAAVEADASRLIEPEVVEPQPFKVGDRVVSRNYCGSSENCFGTVSYIDGWKVYSDNWSVGAPDGWIRADELVHVS